MSKFVKNLVQDAKGIKEQRAKILAEDTKIELETLINQLRKDKRELDVKILNLTDLSPDNTYSLKPGGDNFNAAKWVDEMQDAKIALLNKQVELYTAEETYNEWFTEDVFEN